MRFKASPQQNNPGGALRGNTYVFPRIRFCVFTPIPPFRTARRMGRLRTTCLKYGLLNIFGPLGGGFRTSLADACRRREAAGAEAMPAFSRDTEEGSRASQ